MLSHLLTASQYAASNLLLAQGGGGNTSVKSGDSARMWIKASGLRLSEVGPGTGYLETDLPALLALLRSSELAALPPAQAHEESVRRVQAAVIGESRLRPSLETTFHAVLGRVILHTHPVYVNAFTCLEGGETLLAEILGEAALWCPYVAPGYALGLAIDRICRDHLSTHGRLPSALVLANHGLIASAASAAEAITLTDRFVEVGRRCFGPLPSDATAAAAPPAALFHWAEALQATLHQRPSGSALLARPGRYAALHAAAAEPERWLTAGPLVPDDVVYTGPQVWVAEAALSPGAWLQRNLETVPDKLIIAVPGLGVVLAGPSPRTLDAMEENLLAHVLVRRLIATRGGHPRPLPPAEVTYLLAMESEKYRQRIANSPAL